MLIELVDWLTAHFGDIKGAGLFRYITFRAGIAAILSLTISMIFGGRIIRYLQHLQVGETVRDLGLAGEKQKEGTPTMGGVIIIMAIIIPCLLLARLDNVYIVLLVISTIWMATIGFIDDFIKVFLKNKQGLRGHFKVLGQIGLGLLILVCAMKGDSETHAGQLAAKIAKLRIFGDAEGKMNLSVLDSGGSALVVSQFTLAADTSRGNRPGFSTAAPPAEGERL